MAQQRPQSGKEVDRQGNAVERPKGDGWEPGYPPPKGAVNPPAGEPGHRCLDPKGNYRPDWFSVIIERTPTVSDTQYFSANNSAGGYRVRTGEWVDVPPEVVGILRGTTYEETETKVVPTPDGQAVNKRGVRRVPRFQFSSVPSV